MNISDISLPAEVKDRLRQSGIQVLYPPQEEAIRGGALSFRNLLLASPTASGKTLIAELCALKHVLEGKGKVLYLTPLRAIASEKYQEFMKYSKLKKKSGGFVKVAISTGDYDSSDPWLARYDIIITTNEKIDSLLRHGSDWIYEVSLVVVDEVHILNDPARGPTLEIVLTRLRHVLPSAQFLLLSATLRNAEEIAAWIEAKPITTNWRPVPLKEGVYYDGEVKYADGKCLRIEKVYSDPVLNLVTYALRQKGQALIFCETRKKAVSLAKKIASVLNKFLSKSEQRVLRGLSKEFLTVGERTKVSESLALLIERGVAFHHAGLTHQQRTFIENNFREGRLKVIAATPTLAAGVNLPARVVIIADNKRYDPTYGYLPISVLEYKQMAGRAGRPKYDDIGEAFLIARSRDEQEELLEDYILAEPERLWSKLSIESVLRAHVLSTIASGYARSYRGLTEFFSKTFYAFQYTPSIMESAIRKILDFLLKEGMIEIEGRWIHATRFGKRVSELYIDPLSAIIIRDGLKTRSEHVTEFSFLHLICKTPDIGLRLYPKKGERDIIAKHAYKHEKEFLYAIPEDWVDFEEFLAEVKTSLVLYAWIEEQSEDYILENFRVEPGDLYRLVENAHWLLYATAELAKLFELKNSTKLLTELVGRVKHGVKRELLPLVKLEGIGRVRARRLYEAGFKSVDDLKKAPLHKLVEVPTIGLNLAKSIKEQLSS